MSNSQLPERPSLEYLKKLAKERLATLKTINPETRLADAQLLIARDFGFASWRALKAEIDRRSNPQITRLFEASAAGDIVTVREIIAAHPELVNSREPSDNATPLHIAAANRHLDVVRFLLDAGADVHGHGDAHEGDVIGWATTEGNQAIVDLLLARGARHHIFSAIAAGDLDLIERVVRDDPKQLQRRRSKFENEQSPLHMAVAPPDGLGGAPNSEILKKLIDLGADVNATDNKGRTALALALLRGDREAARILRAAGAAEPSPPPATVDIRALAPAVKAVVPSIDVPDIAAALSWYSSIGFTEVGRHSDGGVVNFGMVALGKAHVAFGMGPGPRHVSLWFHTDRIDDLYAALKARQLQQGDVPFDEDLYEPFYGGRQFSIRDPHGCTLVFYQRPA